VNSGTAGVSDSVFEGNSATLNQAFGDIFSLSTANVSGCGNDGITGDLGAACPTSTGITWITSLSIRIVGSLFLAWMAL